MVRIAPPQFCGHPSLFIPRMWMLSLCGLAVLSIAAVSRAEELTYVNTQGEQVVVTGRLTARGQGMEAFERDDGWIDFIPGGAIVKRDPSVEPAPYSCEQMVEVLERKFSKDLLRTEVRDPFVTAMVLEAPLERTGERGATIFLRRAGKFMENVDSMFMRFAKSMDLPTRELRFPLVMVIFESDDDFDEYFTEISGGRGLQASNVLGVYSAVTNWLAVRMTLLDSFEVPLHEAIHQQAKNRLYHRLAPAPAWFDEGIATGFEGNGERVIVNPTQVNEHFAQLVTRLPQGIDWTQIAGDNASFSTDVLAGNAYTVAWALHWMMVTEHRKTYRDYIVSLSEWDPMNEWKPLELTSREELLGRFEDSFGVTVAEVQESFPKKFEVAVKRQRVNLTPKVNVGSTLEQKAFGQYLIHATEVINLGQLRVGGQLKNISPLRARTFYLTLETGSGLYADWLIPDLQPEKVVPLESQVASKQFSPEIQGSPGSFRVFVRSVPADSDVAEQWKSGRVPGPVSGSTNAVQARPSFFGQ